MSTVPEVTQLAEGEVRPLTMEARTRTSLAHGEPWRRVDPGRTMWLCPVLTF